MPSKGEPTSPNDDGRAARRIVKGLVRVKWLLGVIFCVAAVSPAVDGTELKKRTADAFQHYVERTEIRINSEESDPEHFLYFDSLSDEDKRAMQARLRGGEVVVLPMRTHDDGKDIEVPNGLVHHWQAIGFIPGVTLDQVLQLEEDYSRQAQIYAPDVSRAQLLSRDGHHDVTLFRFHRQAIVTVDYDVKFNVDYCLPENDRAYSSSHAVRIAELQNAGKPNEKELPVGNDHGYMWRLNLYTRYLEKDGGVYIQIEFLALSRTVPAIFAWLVNPYVRSVPRDYLTHYIQATRKALVAENGK
jgi:hypothetical protein